MAAFIPWNSQPLDAWAEKHTPGNFIDLYGLATHYIKNVSGDTVILYGFFFDTFMWNRSIDVLAERFNVYAVDPW